MRAKSKDIIKCTQCNLSFPNAQSLGAHNRHHHPKDLPRSVVRKSPARSETFPQVAMRGLINEIYTANVEELAVENWFLRFLLRRRAVVGADITRDGIMAEVRHEIIKMELELQKDGEKEEV